MLIACSDIIESGAIWSRDIHSRYAKIWQSICNDQVLNVNEKLKFEDSTLNWPNETAELFERDFYNTMTVDILTNKYSCVYITGTPGIVTSLYLLYLIYVLVRQSKESNQKIPNSFYKPNNLESLHISHLRGPVFEEHVPNYVFSDPVDILIVDSQFGPHILVTSNTKYFKEFRKRVDEVRLRGKKFYMDLWSKYELQVISM
jgi:hypothetical protein